ncbi:hypothetical protein CASFOL_029291 [Castilleja foliolosa]|uniref:Uncharacterized protein n=1 Tax=Castilleja foliolosa TaxID=1961234 RepID=A0ABD3CAR2_9LAMI
MALSASPQLSKEKQVNEESDEEESEDDEGSESHSSEEENDKSNNDFSREIGKDEDLKKFESKIDFMSVNNETGSDSNSDPGSPSSYKLQAVSRVSKSASKRSRGDESKSPVPKSKISKSEEVGSFSYTPSPSGKNGNDSVFSNLHLENAFKLSKRVWGGLVGKEKVELEEKEIVMYGKYPFLSRSFDNLSSFMPSLEEMSKSGMSFVFKRLCPSKAEKLDKKWKVLTMEEIELKHRRLTLKKEQMSLIRKCY